MSVLLYPSCGREQSLTTKTAQNSLGVKQRQTNEAEDTMRRVLVVSPHFPPADAVDMHRVRMTVSHYASCGWEPIVLCVRSEHTGRLTDPSLCKTLPRDLEVVGVRAAPERFGINAVGLRAWRSLERSGSRLLRERKIDLVFISTTAFQIMALGRVWRERFGVPFVLDFQDPWATFPASASPFIRRGIKHESMRALHRMLERWTLPSAGGLIAVSERYIDLLAGAYPPLRNVPARVSPFPFSAKDFLVAERKALPVPTLERRGNEVTCVYAGCIAPAMESSLRACFAAVAAGRRQRLEFYNRLRFVFVGTGYAAAGNPPVATRLAREAGIASQVFEHPDRGSFLSAQKSMIEADTLLVLGSEDDGYVPSKLNQCLSLNKPIICAAPAGSRVTAEVSDLETVVTIHSGGQASGELVDNLAVRFTRMLTDFPSELYAERLARTTPFEAASSAKGDCTLFDRVVSQS